MVTSGAQCTPFMRQVRTYAPFERGWLPVGAGADGEACEQVRTYAPFERGWLREVPKDYSIAATVSGLTPRLRGDGYHL